MSQQPRRSIIKGAAWAAPAVLATATIPAYAASKPALDGWLSMESRCRTTMTYTVDGRGTYPDRGLWVSNAPASAQIGATKITLYITNTRISNDPVKYLTFQNGVTINPQWSDLVYDSTAPAKSGYRAYTTTFSGTWQYDTAKKLWFPTSLPYFTASRNTCVTWQFIVVRSVTVNGTVYSFERSGNR